MSLRCLMLVVVLITTEAASGADVMKAVGDRVSFRPDKPLPSLVSIITWKHRNSAGVVVKAIEWDVEDGLVIPNPRFRDITTLDEKTGQITITDLKVEHSGVYTIEINTKEQEQRFTLTFKGADVMKAVGGQVSFRPDKPLPSPVSSITWKHRNSAGVVFKAIEWDEDGFSIPNPRFKGITTLDVKTGQITITDLKVEHSGVYTIELNMREEKQRFPLTVKELVPEPEKSKVIPDVVYLRCEYGDKSVGKNSTGEELKCSVFPPKEESSTVKNEGNLANFYTCTPDKSASTTSDPV